ncbi:MAG: TPM domain-containing protein [Endomicrobiales bacterium]|nr:TPM domain-containing protein [Endomicrobiales bacterium]
MNRIISKKGRYYFSLLFLCLLALFSAQSVFAARYPKPRDWVSDFANVIDPSYKQKVSSVLTELEQKTSAEISVVTIRSLGNETIESLAVQLFQEWGIGKKGKDNGVLFITSIGERKTRIEVGYGLEGILPDGLTGEILDKYVIPEFKKGDYGRGITLGTFAIASIIADDAGVELTGGIRPASRPGGKPSLLRTIFNFIFLVIMGILFIRNPFLFLLFLGMGGRGGRFGGGGFGGGFGGFGGGMSGGGGSSRGW